MSELIYCPECGHPKWDKDHFNCTYESIAGEKGAEYAKSFTPPDTVSFFHDAKPEPSLSLLVIDLGDSCVVKVEKGEWKRRTVTLYRGSATITLPFQRLREELDGEKPVPRIERDDIKIYERYRIYFNDTSYPLPLNVWDAICELVGKPLPIYSEDKWEELIALQSKNEYGNWIDERDFTAWRFTR